MYAKRILFRSPYSRQSIFILITVQLPFCKYDIRPYLINLNYNQNFIFLIILKISSEKLASTTSASLKTFKKIFNYLKLTHIKKNNNSWIINFRKTFNYLKLAYNFNFFKSQIINFNSCRS